MQLVSGDDRPVARIAPKVFSDLPSAAELQEERNKAETANRSRNVLFIATMVLGGMLAVAGAVAVVATLGRESDRGVYAKQIEDLEEKIALKDDQLKAQSSQLAQLGAYAPISDLRRQSAEVRDEIRELLADPSRGNLRTRLRGADWKRFDQGLPNWEEQAKVALEQDIQVLSTLSQRIKALPPMTVTVQTQTRTNDRPN